MPVGLGAVWANRAFFSGLRVVLALELSTYFTIFPVRALQVWVTLCSSWNLHTDCKESIGRFICPSVAGGMSWPLLQISTSWFPYFLLDCMFPGPLTLKSLGKLVELNALFCESLTFLIWHFCKWQVKFSGFTFLQLVFPAPVQGYQRVQVSSVLWWALCLFLSLQTVIFRVFLGVCLKTLSGFPVCLPCLHVLRSLERSTALFSEAG